MVLMSLEKQIIAKTSWLREQHDLTAARLSYLLREQGVDAKTLICAKIFPGLADPTGGVLITPQGKVFQFSFNRAGMIIESARIDEWINVTQTYMQHPWRDEILAGLEILKNTQKTFTTPGVGKVVRNEL